MSGFPSGEIAGPGRIVRLERSAAEPRYSLCTMVTRWDQYRQSRDRFLTMGFDRRDCEYLTVDNSRENVADSYRSINEFLQAASGEFIVLVHQDAFLLDDGRAGLDDILEQLGRADEHWGLCGNSGRTDDGWPVICLSDPHADHRALGAPFPARVVSLDENFIVVRREANLAVSRDLGGFHHYGADLCIVADILGWNAYVIGFYLRHDSRGSIDESYVRSHQAIAAKYRRALRPRWVYVSTRRSFFIAGRRTEALVARVLRYAGKLVGVVPRYHHFDDDRRRARRDARRRQ